MRHRGIIGYAVFLCALLAAGCGSNAATTTTSPPPPTATTAAGPPTSLTIFRVENGKLRAEVAQVPHTTAFASASLDALGLESTVTIAGGTAHVALEHATADEVAEMVYTLTQYPTVQRVDVAGRTGLTRDDVAGYVPTILVESPAAGARVSKTFRVKGSASVFEATLVVELVIDGQVVRKTTVTASEGAPARGTFDTPVQAPTPGQARVVAFAPSAENGEPQHKVEVPVTITP